METAQGLSGFFNSITPWLGGDVGHYLVTFLIFGAGLFAAKILRSWLVKRLSSSKLMDKIPATTDRVGIAKSISQIAYYFVVLNVMLVVLERLNVTSVLDPLQGLATQFMSALPRIIGAGIIFYAGWIIANLVATVVGMAAKKLDDLVEEKGYPIEFKTSKFLSAIVLGTILLPVTVAGFEFLAIDAISIPAVAMISKFMMAVPNIIAAGLILICSYVVGRFVIFMLSGLLDGLSVDAIPEKLGFQSAMPKGKTFKGILGSVTMFFIMLTATTAAIEKLQIQIASDIFAKILEFGGGVLLGTVILMVGLFLSNLAYDKISASTTNTGLANICRFAIIGLVLAMGLKSMGLADNIVNMAFAFTFGSVALASAIAFGTGGKVAAEELTLKWVRDNKNSGATGTYAKTSPQGTSSDAQL